MLKRPTDAPALYSQDGKGYDAIVHAHYFLGANDWLVTEYDPAEDVGFGWACLNGDRQNAELGYVPLDEMAEVRVPLTLNVNGVDQVIGSTGIEYDEHWEPVTIREAIALLDRRSGREA